MSECEDCGEERKDVKTRKTVTTDGDQRTNNLCVSCARARRQMPGVRDCTKNFAAVTVSGP